jgi:8-oxo-dGTP pyrophosphatase MutT (NUDIX family)
MNNKRIEVAIAILHCSEGFLMQLRDDIPNIIYPGYWGFFGGHIDPGEAPKAAVMRELLEEISYTPPWVTKFACHSDSQVLRHVFHAPLTVELNQLVLQEGWDMGILTPEQIKAGRCYSQKANQVRPLAPPHQALLLNFIEQDIVATKEKIT